MTSYQELPNRKCPDYGSHAENVADLLYPDWTRRLLSADEQAAVDAEALVEYRNCEGHS